MDKYAVIKIGGTQLKVSEGQIFKIDHQDKINLSVLAYSDGKSLSVGEPTLDDVVVKTTILENKKDKKVIVARYKSKSRYRKTKGHRQPISVVKVDSITQGASKKTDKKAEVKKEAKSTTKDKKESTKKVTTKKGEK